VAGAHGAPGRARLAGDVSGQPRGDVEAAGRRDDLPGHGLPRALQLDVGTATPGLFAEPAEVTLPWVEKGKPNSKPVTAGLLFTTPAGAAIRRTTFNDTWRASLMTAGIEQRPDNGCHVLRHTAASAWLAAGVDIRTVAEFLGHNDPGFTLRTYTHFIPDAADRARKAMDAFFSATSPEGSSALVVPSGRST
jgi:hypothetical protein